MNDNATNPWQTLSKNIAYENPWVRVVENKVIRPDGAPGHYDVVEFKRVATGIVPIDNENYTWLVGQYRYPHDTYEWEIPEGGSEEGESPLEAAQRELREETGLLAKQWEPLMELQLSNCVSNEVAHIFIAKNLTITKAQPDGDEKIALHRLPLEEAIQMAQEGKIHDAMSVAALLKIGALLLFSSTEENKE